VGPVTLARPRAIFARLGHFAVTTTLARAHVLLLPGEDTLYGEGNVFDTYVVMGGSVCSSQRCRFSECNSEKLEETWRSSGGSRH
jgi:hypothetical protein